MTIKEIGGGGGCRGYLSKLCLHYTCTSHFALIDLILGVTGQIIWDEFFNVIFCTVLSNNTIMVTE
jgi:hypothetical protein